MKKQFGKFFGMISALAISFAAAIFAHADTLSYKWSIIYERVGAKTGILTGEAATFTDADILRFEIQYRKNMETNWVLLNITDSTLRDYTKSGLDPGKYHNQMRVCLREKNNDGSDRCGLWTKDIIVDALTETVPPSEYDLKPVEPGGWHVNGTS